MNINIAYGGLKTARIQYTIDFLNDHPLVKGRISFHLNDKGERMTQISYGGEKRLNKQGNGYFLPVESIIWETIVPGPFFCNAYLFKDIVCYSIERKSCPTKPFLQDMDFQFDWLATIFFHISRYEEWGKGAADIDYTGWLKEDHHCLVRFGLEKEPVVDQLISLLVEVFTGQRSQLNTSYSLSHDLDVIHRFKPYWRFGRSILASIIYGRGIKQISRDFRAFKNLVWHGAHDPYDTFDWLLYNGNGLPKRLYLMAGGTSKYDNFYTLKNKYLKVIVALARERGYEIGIHPSYYAGFDELQFEKEQQALSKYLREPVIYSRQHLLRFSWAVTPGIIERRGIQEDASMGYNRRLGFRCGTGFPYHMYDFIKEEAYPWLERPLVFMESSAIHESRRLARPIQELMNEFFAANRFNTKVGINFHNSNFDPTLSVGRTLAEFYIDKLPELLK